MKPLRMRAPSIGSVLLGRRSGAGSWRAPRSRNRKKDDTKPAAGAVRRRRCRRRRASRSTTPPKPTAATIDMGAEEPAAGDLAADLSCRRAGDTRGEGGPGEEDAAVVEGHPRRRSQAVPQGAAAPSCMPMVGTTMNDNMIRHYTIGGELAYYLTDVLAVGVEGQYYVHDVPRAVRSRRAPGAPAADGQHVQLERRAQLPLRARLRKVRGVRQASSSPGRCSSPPASAPVRARSIPRDTKFPGFTNLLIMPNVGASMRFFLAKWLTVNVGIRDYIFIDKFEPTNRSPTMNATADEAKDNADARSSTTSCSRSASASGCRRRSSTPPSAEPRGTQTMNKHSFLAVGRRSSRSPCSPAADALAERRTSGLEKDVAVRHRRLLVKNRFELAPLFESTINADFRHIIGGGAQARVPPPRHALDRRDRRRLDRAQHRAWSNASCRRSRHGSTTRRASRASDEFMTPPQHDAVPRRRVRQPHAVVRQARRVRPGVRRVRLLLPGRRLVRAAQERTARRASATTRRPASRARRSERRDASRPTTTRTTTTRSTAAAASASTSAAASTSSSTTSSRST